MIAKKVLIDKSTCCKFYRIEIDLRDERLKKSNKFLDKMVKLLQKLNSVDKIYFRFVPDRNSCSSSTLMSIAAANKLSCEFFKHVIEEYAFDGCLPVPLANCSIISQRIERSWLNCSQLHPNLDLSEVIKDDDEWLFQNGSSFGGVGRIGGGASTCAGNGENGDEDSCNGNVNNDDGDEARGDGGDDLLRNRLDANLTCLVDIIEWLGYQLLLLDCDRYEIQSKYSIAPPPASTYNKNDENTAAAIGQQTSSTCKNTSERLDVSCTQIVGPIDFQQVQENLNRLFGTSGNKSLDDNIVLRALILYNDPSSCSETPASNDNGNFYGMSTNGRHVVYIQDCAGGAKAANTITVIGMSAFAN